MMAWLALNSWPLAFLTVAVIDDLLFKKFHNSLFITLTVLAIAYAVFLSPLTFQESTTGFLAGGFLLLPWVLLKALGAGDMKFMMAFGLLLGANATLWVFVYSLFWGTCIGLLKALLAGQIKIIFLNISQIFKNQAPAAPVSIPFTVAILFGWLTWLQLGGVL